MRIIEIPYPFIQDLKKLSNILSVKKDDTVILDFKSQKMIINGIISVKINENVFTDNKDEISKKTPVVFTDFPEKIKKMEKLFNGNSVIIEEDENFYFIKSGAAALQYPKLQKEVITENLNLYNAIITNIKSENTNKIFSDVLPDNFSDFIKVNKNDETISLLLKNNEVIAFTSYDTTLLISDKYTIEEIIKNQQEFIKLDIPNKVLKVQYPQDNVQMNIYFNENSYDYFIKFSFDTSTFKTNFVHKISVYTITTAAPETEILI